MDERNNYDGRFKPDHSSPVMHAPGTCFVSLDDYGVHYYRQDLQRVMHVLLQKEKSFLITDLPANYLSRAIGHDDEFKEVPLTEFEAALEQAISRCKG